MYRFCFLMWTFIYRFIKYGWRLHSKLLVPMAIILKGVVALTVGDAASPEWLILLRQPAAPGDRCPLVSRRDRTTERVDFGAPAS